MCEVYFEKIHCMCECYGKIKWNDNVYWLGFEDGGTLLLSLL